MIDWLVQALVASTVLIALVIPLRGIVSRAFGARAAYALWALPALRFLMPSLPGSRGFVVPVLSFGPQHQVIGITSPDEAAVMLADPRSLTFSPITGHPTDWMSLAVSLWAAGAMLWFGWQLLGYQRFLARAMRSARLLTRECGVDVLLSDAVDGPVAAGILKRRIFLPIDFMTRYAPAERRFALLHEGAHHDRRDIVANLVAMAVMALHWFNPLAHRAYRLFRADQELACDETVLTEIGRDERHAYGSAVVKAAGARMPGVACALGHRAELKRRLRSMARPMPGTIRSRFGLLLAVLGIGAGLALTAPSQSAVELNRASELDLAAIRVDADAARHEADLSRAEGREAAAVARYEAARGVAMASRQMIRTEFAAAREAEQAGAEAARAAAAARRDSDRARRAMSSARVRIALARAPFGGVDAARELATVRQSMAAHCAQRGKPVPPTAGWDQLTLCGDSGAAMVARVHERFVAHETGQ